MAERSSLVRLLEEYDLELDWRGFELHPETPRGGIAMSDYFPPDRLPAMRQHLIEVAEHFGVTGMKFNERMPNTRRALMLAEIARDEGKLQRFRDIAMDMHWLRGRDLEDDVTLADAAKEAGLSDDAAARAVEGSEYARRVDEMRAEADGVGVTGIPTFVLGRYGVVGAQPYEVLEELAKRAGARKRS